MVLLQKLIIIQLMKKISLNVWKPKIHYRIINFTRTRHWPLPWAHWTQSTLPLIFFQAHFNIILPSTSRSSKSLFPSGFLARTLYTHVFFPAQLSAPSTHLTLLNLIALVILARSTDDGATPHVANISYLLYFLYLTFMGPCIVNVFLSMTNKMQRCIILFINVNAVHVSSGFSAHHQELAVTANKFDKYPMLHIQTSAPEDEGKNRSKHAERWH